MAGGVRVIQPDALPEPGRTPEIDTVRVTVDGEERERQRIVVAAAQATATFGQVASVQPGATGVAVTRTLLVPSYVNGFSATGNGDGYFRLLVGATTVLTARIDNMTRSIERLLPVGLRVPANAAVTLDVRCESRIACTFEGTIYTEINDG